MIAGTLEIQMLANMARLAEDMSKAKGIVGDAVGAIEKMLGAIGVGFSANALLEKIDSVTEGMAKLEHESDKTGASVENLSKLQFFAGVSGSSIDGVTSALVKLSKAEAASGNASAPASQALKFLGLSAKDAAGNLKDPSVLFGEIAQKLIGYQDGAGKAAIAQALFGKAGAELLPTLKKMAELGDIEASVTTAQAAAAEAYRLEVAKLNQQKEILWNTVVSALLPTMQTFVGVLLDASKKTDSLGSAAKGLAANGSIESWADAGAMGVARLVDLIKIIPDTLSAVMASFKAAQADLELLPKHAAIIASFLTPGGLTKAEGDAAYKELLDEQVRLTVEANTKLADLYNSDKTAFSRAVAEKIALRKAAEVFKATEGGTAAEVKGKPLNFEPGDAAKAAAELKLYEGALQKLELELGRVNEMTNAQKIAYELTDGSLKTLNLTHAAMLLSVAAEVDKRKEFLAVNKLDIDAYEAMFKVREQLGAIQAAANDADKTYVDDLKYQVDLIGKTTIEQQQMNEARKVDLGLRAQLKAVADTVGISPAELNAATAALEKQAADQKAVVLASVAVRVKAERDWATGAGAAFNDYIDHATNAAEQSKMLFTNAFKNMEDALVTFVQTGKLDFKSLADSIISDLIRIQIRQSITGPAAQYMKDNGGFMGSLGKLFGSGAGTAGTASSGGEAEAFAAGLTPMATGTDYVPSTGPYLLHQGEKVTPASANDGGGTSNVFQVDMRGASVDAVARLERLVMQVNGSIESRALNVVSQARRRGAG